MKFDIFNTAAFPAAPGGAATATVNLVGTQFGSTYQLTTGLTPLVTELTRFHTGGAGQTDIIGNRVMYNSFNVKLFCQPIENQGSIDQISFRFSVVRLKQASYLPGAVTNGATFVRALMWGGMASTSGTATSVSQFTTTPFDKTKVQVLYDKVKRVHATPQTVSTQLNCHFKTVNFSWRKRFPKGLPIQYDTTHDFASASQTLYPIVVICQCMEPVTSGPISQTMTFSLTTDSFISATWRDM